ncbi:DHA2 family multidrug resistance protein-like MFS transporter [Tamaricihabitans halophyticus]|uniref:DHA2 family multidrug resistance protein-like MFS transporter n=1 Tax=Tamaricihabitans halophyticus TaxID=1262583 RepID=A0A4R2RBH4_9PSEU|nr:MFS transporter [Tamaricihabitans halophyticus]TCP56765.1 DHA2 family multidrug resistance protein-like MFS transporter [Tamaricihabitans halophyticus]
MLPSPPTATARTWLGLAILLLPALLVAMDISVLFIAAPEIVESLRPSTNQWLWAMDIYGFVIASLLITMGSLGDRIGRRKLLLIGASLFGTASVFVAYAPNAELLIVGRALLAIGGATLAPSTLSLIRNMFPDPGQRRIAVGCWTAAFGGGAVAGPIIAGILLEYFWWGSVFLINVPVMILLLLAGPLLVPESRQSSQGGFDLPGAALSLVAILGLVFALKDTAQHGPTAVGAFAATIGIAGLVAFGAHQRRARHPLIDINLFRLPAFAAAIGANTIITVATVGTGSLAFIFLQTVHELSALDAALWTLPTFAGTMAGAATATPLLGRTRAGTTLTSGLLCAATGFVVVAIGSSDTSMAVFLTGYTVLTFGVGLTATSANTLVLGSAPAKDAGAASGIAETSTELGGAVGIAVFGAISGAVYSAGIADAPGVSTDPAAGETVNGTLAVADNLAEPQASALRNAAVAAYSDSVGAAALSGMTITIVTATVIWWLLRRTRPDPLPDSTADQESRAR